MRFQKGLMIVTLGLAGLIHPAHAEGVDSFRTDRVSRKTGGQMIYHQLDLSVSTEVELTFSVKGGEIRIGNLKAITDADDVISVQSAQIIGNTPRDAQGRFILKEGAASLKVFFSGDDRQINVIAFRAEAYQANAQLSMKAAAVGSREEGGYDGENQCQRQITDLTSRLLACTRDSQGAVHEVRRLQTNLAQLEVALDQRNRPLRQCSEATTERNRILEDLNTRHRALEQDIAGRRSQLEAHRALLEESQAAEFECYVRGRHEGFRARGRTRAEAIANTVNLCGVNNCGKRNWKINYDCRVVR